MIVGPTSHRQLYSTATHPLCQGGYDAVSNHSWLRAAKPRTFTAHRGAANRTLRFSLHEATAPTAPSRRQAETPSRMQWRANKYLKSTSFQAATLVAAHAAQMGWSGKHVSRLYGRIRRKKGHSIVVGAVARHLPRRHSGCSRNRNPTENPTRSHPGRGKRGPNLSAERRACVLERRELTLGTRVDCHASVEDAHAALTANLSRVGQAG